VDDGGLTLYEIELTREDDVVERLVTLRSVAYLGDGDCVENLPLSAWGAPERTEPRAWTTQGA
jgi:hypothetical protein